MRTSEPDEASRPIPSTSSSASTRPNENNDEITAAPDNSTKSEKGAGREVDPQPPSSSPHDSEDSFLLVSPSASYPQTGGSTGSISSTSSICTGDAESGRGAAGGAAVAGTGTTARSHHFADATPTNTWLGQGSYGVVWRVQCIHCRRVSVTLLCPFPPPNEEESFNHGSFGRNLPRRSSSLTLD